MHLGKPNVLSEPHQSQILEGSRLPSVADFSFITDTFVIDVCVRNTSPASKPMFGRTSIAFPIKKLLRRPLSLFLQLPQTVPDGLDKCMMVPIKNSCFKKSRCLLYMNTGVRVLTIQSFISVNTVQVL